MEKEYFPDGTPIDGWFYQTQIPTLEELGPQYVITDHGVNEDGKVYTQQIQDLIDRAFQAGGGVIVVPRGVYYTGALFFKQGVHLYIAEGGVLKGSNDISDYKVMTTRIEGETCPYFCALINADAVDNFTICGEGTIDGNGERFWKAFWLRRKWNPGCTNKDEQRPRLVFISNSTNVTVAGVHLQNSPFWTNHIYKCNHVRFLNCQINNPHEPILAPSTDAIDIDVCTDVLVKGCQINVNDDGVVLKGGKGLDADALPENGMNERILVEDCVYDYCHGCLTCGSESIHNRNVILRRSKVKAATKFLMLKMRPDTPQLYEHIRISQMEGRVDDFIDVFNWTQFFDLKGRDSIPASTARHITLSDCRFTCRNYFQYLPGQSWCSLSDFTFEDLQIKAQKDGFDPDAIENVTVRNVHITVNE